MIRRPILQEREMNGWDIVKAAIYAFALITVASIAGLSWVVSTLASNPVVFAAEGGVECGAVVDGNLQFDYRTVDLTNKTMPRSGGLYRYALTDNVVAELINVPDFKQAKLTHVDGHCKANGAVEGSVPALLLISSLTLNPSNFESSVLEGAYAED